MRSLLLGALQLSLLCSTVALAEMPKWEQIHQDEGITVWQRAVKGSSLVEFRGRGTISASLIDVAAVIRGADRQKEWMKDCVGSAIYKMQPNGRSITYHRVGSPAFFISDRDVVLKAETEVFAKEQKFIVRFQETEYAGQPPLDGVVRMPKLTGHWTLQAKGKDKTFVEYQVRADPGGSLPAWLVNLTSKKLPYYTLVSLRKQVKMPGYETHRQIIQKQLSVDSSSGSEAAKVKTSSQAKDGQAQ